MPRPHSLPLRVFIADDHPVVLGGVRSILENAGFRIVGEAQSAGGVLEALAETRCDVLLTDLIMPGGNCPDGLEYIRLLRQKHPLLPIVVLTMMSNIGLLDILLRRGVLGIVHKGEDMSRLPLAIQSAAARRVFVSPGLRAQMDAVKQDVKGIALSVKETEVIRLLASGMSATEIARLNGKSLKTISRQKMNAMRKLGLNNEAELYMYTRKHGLF